MKRIMKQSKFWIMSDLAWLLIGVTAGLLFLVAVIRKVEMLLQ